MWCDRKAFRRDGLLLQWREHLRDLPTYIKHGTVRLLLLMAALMLLSPLFVLVVSSLGD